MTIEYLYHISDYLRFQVDGIKRIIIGNSSSLPASMSNIRTNLENGEKIEKFCVGPTRFNPGPILFNTVTTEVKFVEKIKLIHTDQEHRSQQQYKINDQKYVRGT